MLLLFIIIGTFYLACSANYQYHFVAQRGNWTEAQSYCRQTYTDLATVFSRHDMETLAAAIPSDFSGRAWIGLERGAQWRWQWSLSDRDFYADGDLSFRNWRLGHPNSVSEDKCAVLESNGEWFDDGCNTQRPFVCFNESAVENQRYVLIEENKSWREAQSLCRERHLDLVSVRSAAENEVIRAVVNSQVWIGLFSDPWVWSDQSNSSYRFWRSNQPNNFQNDQDCVSINAIDWNDLRCNTSRRFFCYSEMTAPTVAPQSTIPHPQTPDTTPGNPDQASTPIYTESSQIPTTTGNTYYTYTQSTLVAATSTSQNTGFTPSTSNSELQTTTEGTINISSDQVTTSHTTQILNISEEEVTTHTPIHPITGDPTTASLSFEDTMVLVQENMSWIEALIFCQAHHSDLVSVTDAHVHQELVEKVGNATTSHVWLGLRYTCKFSFWFWVSSASSAVCFQNWAPGHGPVGGQTQCGLAGAMEARRGKQWVSLPETQRLNFMCRL